LAARSARPQAVRVSMGAQARSRGLLCCGVAALVFGALCLFLGIYLTAVLVTFTPVYSDIECEMGAPRVSNVRIDETLRFDMVATVTCFNPNPYDVTVMGTEVGQVYAGDDRQEAGTINQIPVSTFPSGGEGTVVANLAIAPSGELFSSLPLIVLSGEIPLYFDIKLSVKVDARFLVGKYTTEVPFNKKCGVRYMILVPLKVETSPMACQDAWDKLAVPAAGSSSAESMSFSAENMAADDVDDATQQKDLYLGIAMACTYFLGALGIAAGAFAMWRSCRRPQIET